MKIRIKRWIIGIVWIGIVLNSSGCEKNKTQSPSGSVQKYNYTFMEDGILYCNPQTRRAEFYDYAAQSYIPICGKANCRHQYGDETCTAVWLERGGCVGRIGDKWYYHCDSFFSCDLDGSNEKELGEFHHTLSPLGVRIFRDNSIICATFDIDFDEETEEPLDSSAIYRFHFDTGEIEIICPEIQSDLPAYEVVGLYENQLIYREWTREYGKRTKMIDLDSGTITEPIGTVESARDMVIEGDSLITTVADGGDCSAAEFNLKTGEQRTLLEKVKSGVNVYWGTELKQLQTIEIRGFRDWHMETYQYQEDKGCALFREGDVYHEMEVLMVKNGQVIGRIGDPGDEDVMFDLVVISLEDYLAGKTNWKLLEY